MANTPAEPQAALQTLQGARFFLKPYRRLIIIGALVGMLAGVLIGLFRPIEYATNATLLFPASATGVAGLAALGGGEQMSSVPLLGGLLQVPRPGTNAKTAIILLRSRPVQNVIIAKYRLSEHWKLKKPAAIRKRLMKQLALREGEAGDLSLTFVDSDRDLSYNVTRTFVDELKRQSTKLGINPAEQTVAFLTKQVQAAEDDVMAIQQDVQRFEERHGMVSLPEQVIALARQYSSLQDDVEKARIESTVATSYATMLTTKAQQLIAKSMDPAPNQTQLNGLYQKVAELEAQRELLRDRYTTTSPEVEEVALQLKVARQRLSDEMTRQLSLVDGGTSPVVGEAIIDAALKQTRLTRLNGLLDELKKEIGTYPVMKSRFARLTLDATTREARLTLLRTELEKARIIAQSQGPAFIEAEPAAPAEEPQERRLLIILVMTVLGTLVTAMIPFFKWQQALNTQADAVRGSV